MLQVKLLENKKSHDNLLFCVDGLTAELRFDTYYYEVAAKDITDFQDLNSMVAKLFDYWLKKANELKEEQEIYLPVDFSDQNTSGLKVKKMGDNFNLTFGSTRREGWSVNPLDPNDFCYDTTDFHDTVGHSLTVLKNDFINSLTSQIDDLKNTN